VLALTRAIDYRRDRGSRVAERELSPCPGRAANRAPAPSGAGRSGAEPMLTELPTRTKLEVPVRCAFSIGVIAALLLGFVEAPFAHTHDRADGADHHAAEEAHAHAARVVAHTAGLAFDRIDPADDERSSNWFQTVQAATPFVYVVPQQTRVVPAIVASERVRPAPLTCSHDPPVISELPSRAPPTIPA
jgi:hypothetical protein